MYSVTDSLCKFELCLTALHLYACLKMQVRKVLQMLSLYERSYIIWSLTTERDKK